MATNLALDLMRESDPASRVLAFFDDDPRTWHKRPHDIPIVGMPECLLNPEWSGNSMRLLSRCPRGVRAHSGNWGDAAEVAAQDDDCLNVAGDED